MELKLGLQLKIISIIEKCTLEFPRVQGGVINFLVLIDQQIVSVEVDISVIQQPKDHEDHSLTSLNRVKSKSLSSSHMISIIMLTSRVSRCLKVSLLKSSTGSVFLSILCSPGMVVCGPVQKTRPWQNRFP